MPKLKDISGQKFNFLLVISRDKSDKSGRTKWNCLCDCGNYVSVRTDSLKNGNNKSCGCYHKIAHKTHGKKGTPEYQSWQAMKQRCCNPNKNNYKYYGGKGIKVCDRWVESFSKFLTDMGPRPKGTTIDRMNSNLGYFPANCIWSTQKSQNNNKSNNKRITYKGVTMTHREWSSKLGNNLTIVHKRLKSGWSEEMAITTPVRGYKKY